METIAKVETTKEEEIPKEVLERIPTTPEEEAPEEEATPVLIDTYCPHCGMDSKAAPMVVSEEDRDDWVRHILSGGTRRFKKTYSLYGGRVRVTLKSRTGLEERDIDKAVEVVTRSIQTIADIQKIRVETLRVQLSYSIDKIVFVDVKDPKNTRTDTFETPTPEAIREAWARGAIIGLTEYDTLLANVHVALINLISEKLTIFDGLCAALTIEGLSPDF